MEQLPKSVLIVDDDQTIRETLQSCLEAEGYHVHTAANGKQALEKLKEIDQPNIILLDMVMPIMNGWTFLDILRSDRSLSAIPIVIVSSYAETGRSVRPNAVVRKPVPLFELLSVLDEVCA